MVAKEIFSDERLKALLAKSRDFIDNVGTFLDPDKNARENNSLPYPVAPKIPVSKDATKH